MIPDKETAIRKRMTRIFLIILLVVACAVAIVYMITMFDTFGAESNPTGSPIGGGKGYIQIYTENDSQIDYRVTTKDEFISALADAKAGDVIYVPESANINLTGIYGTTIPAGVIVAGNRGEGGSSGGRIFQNRLPDDPSGEQWTYEIGSMLRPAGDNIRITGLRLEGPDKTPADVKSMGFGIRCGVYERNRNNIEVDNCELWGWSWAAVGVYGGNAYVHHNYIHHCQDSGFGYGVVVTGGTALIEANIFDYTKHAVSASGHVGESYEARYNLVVGHSGYHVFDVHEFNNPETGKLIAGSSYKIHHNTVNETTNCAVGIRAIPLEGAWIHHNKFQWATKLGGDNPPVFQINGEGKVYMKQNLIGTPGVLYWEGPIWHPSRIP